MKRKSELIEKKRQKKWTFLSLASTVSPTWQCLCALHTMRWSFPPTCQLSFDTASKPDATTWNQLTKKKKKYWRHFVSFRDCVLIWHRCLLFLATVHPVRGIQACENLDRSRHTVGGRGRRRLEKPEWNTFTLTLGIVSALLTPYIKKYKKDSKWLFTLAWTAYDANRTEASGEQNISSSKICFFTYKKFQDIHTCSSSHSAMT